MSDNGLEKKWREHYTRLIYAEIKQMERFREQALKRSSGDNVSRFDQKITKLKEELESTETERYMTFIEEQEETAAYQRKRNEDRKSALMDEAKQKSAMQSFYDRENAARRSERNMQYMAKREWEWLCTQDERLPDYIRTNLTRMPGNKGYIWKGIWYFGKLQADPRDPIVMFEKPRGSSDMLIHEMKYNQYHRIFKKNRNPPNTLLSETIY